MIETLKQQSERYHLFLWEKNRNQEKLQQKQHFDQSEMLMFFFYRPAIVCMNMCILWFI